jgi:hypothetical protein
MFRPRGKVPTSFDVQHVPALHPDKFTPAVNQRCARCILQLFHPESDRSGLYNWLTDPACPGGFEKLLQLGDHRRNLLPFLWHLAPPSYASIAKKISKG